MQLQERASTDTGLEALGLGRVRAVHWNLTVPELYEETVRKGLGLVAKSGALVVETGEHTGRSPRDKFIVEEPSSKDKIGWGKTNQPFSPEKFDAILARMAAYLQNREIYVQDCYAGADPKERLPVRVITEVSWHSLFARTLLFPAGKAGEPLEGNEDTRFTIVSAPGFSADPAIDGTRTGTFILVNFERRLILIGGTTYAGEIKKSVFSTLNYLLPLKGVFPMHCSANMGVDGDVTILFGLSGTGKTTLSADPERLLIGDDEHGWSDTGVFNFEHGCYAKMINLSEKSEPDIYAASMRFGSVLENVVIDPVSRELDLNDSSKTENIRSAYPISYIPRIAEGGVGGHPNTVIFLTADAFGVLPPVARLTPDQAMYHFLSGYTARVAGTEKGVTDPEATFSTCFGAPFMAHPPQVYAKMLGEKIAKHNAAVYLINTGWQGGPYGVGKRISIGHTRAIVTAAINGSLNNVETTIGPNFGLPIPKHVEGVPDDLLDPRKSWSDGAAYDAQAKKLAGMFKENFKQYEDSVSDSVKAAGPKV